MSNHTPGPWVIDSEDCDLFTQNQSRMWINATGMHIGYVDGPRTSERIANGRLIAAAPEMYELIECLSQSYDYSKSSHDLASTLYDLRCMALRLMAKIEGGGE